MDGLSSNSVSRSIKAIKRGGTGEASLLRALSSRAPISSQIALQWMESSVKTIFFWFDMADLAFRTQFNMSESRKSKFFSTLGKLVKKPLRTGRDRIKIESSTDWLRVRWSGHGKPAFLIKGFWNRGRDALLRIYRF